LDNSGGGKTIGLRDALQEEKGGGGAAGLQLPAKQNLKKHTRFVDTMI